MGNPKLITLLFDFPGNRDIAQHPQGHQDRDHFPKELHDYLFRYYFLLFLTVLAFFTWIHWENFTYLIRPIGTATHIPVTGLPSPRTGLDY